eukprot:Nk52_evm1s1111 gene=Nk52_evmTU1s1111
MKCRGSISFASRRSITSGSGISSSNNCYASDQVKEGKATGSLRRERFMVERVQVDVDELLGSDYTDRQSSVKRAVFNLLCAVIGAGVLGLPTGMSAVGWVYGIVLLAVATASAGYCGILVGRMMDHLGEKEKEAVAAKRRIEDKEAAERMMLGVQVDDMVTVVMKKKMSSPEIRNEAQETPEEETVSQCRQYVIDTTMKLPSGRDFYTFEDLGEVAFGKAGRWCAVACSYGTLFFVSILMLVLAAQMWEAIFPGTFDVKVWVLLTCVCVAPLLTIRTFNHIAFVSFVGMAAMAVVVSYVSVYCFVDYSSRSDFDDASNKYSHINMADVDANSLATTFTTIFFSLGVAPLFAETRRCLRNPEENYRKVMYGTFSITFVIYFLVFFAGYFVYGNYLLSNEVEGNIALAMPSGPGRTLISVLILIHVIAAYTVVSNPLSRSIEHACKIDRFGTWRSWVYMWSIRIAMLALHGFIAILIPFFFLLMNLIGATTSNFACFTLPCLFYLKVCGAYHLWFTRKVSIKPVSAPDAGVLQGDLEQEPSPGEISGSKRVVGILEALVVISIICLSLLAGVIGAKEAIEAMIAADYSLF